jgi:hydroxyacylglutathione hydrolase
MMDIEFIPAFQTNYIYLLTEESGKVAVVDPGDPRPVIKLLKDRGLKLDYILNTHHHADHTGGNLQLKERYDCTIIGPKVDEHRIPGMDSGLSEGDSFQFGELEAKILETHGHTNGHICFWFPAAKTLFCGDTLFSMGCGRLFEGTPKQMWDSLSKIAELPDDTMVYCGHEYTENGGNFCLTIEPDNEDLQARMEDVRKLRANDERTLPVSLGTEKKTNAFLRAGSAERFAEIRRLKDAY